MSARITKRAIFRLVFIPSSLNREPDELLVINNASTDETATVAAQIPFVQVIDEPRIWGWWLPGKQGGATRRATS